MILDACGDKLLAHKFWWMPVSQLLFIIMSWPAVSVYAADFRRHLPQERLVITEENQELPALIGPYTRIWRDSSHKAEPYEAYQNTLQQAAQGQDVPVFGYTTDQFWILFDVENLLDSPITRILQVIMSCNEFSIYQVSEEGIKEITHYYRGQHVSYKDHYYRFPYVNLEIPANSHSSFLIRIRSSYSMMLRIWLITGEELIYRDRSDHIIFGIYFGIITFAVFSGFILFILSRFRPFLLYTLTIFFYQFLFMLVNYGFLNPIFQLSPWISERSIYLSLELANLVGYFFFIQVSNFHRFFPKISRFCKVLPIKSLILIGIAFFYFDARLVKICIDLSGAIVLFYVLAGIMCAFKGYHAAIYFTCGWSSLLLASMMYAILSSNPSFNPDYEWRRFFMQDLMLIGSVVSCFFLLIAIGLKFRKHLVNSLKNQEKMRRLEKNLKDAHQLQTMLFTHRPHPENIQICSSYHPAEEISGDWYAYYYCEKTQKLFFAIADVSGHGISSALITGALHGAFYSQIEHIALGEGGTEAKMQRLIQALNRTIRESNPQEEFLATLSLITIDLANDEMIYTNQGHQPFLQLRAGKVNCHLLPSSPLGLYTEPVLAFEKYSLEKDDIIILFTDGWLENHNSHEKPISFHQFEKQFEFCSELEDVELGFAQIKLERFSGPVIEDDFTYVIIKYLGPIPQSLTEKQELKKIVS